MGEGSPQTTTDFSAQYVVAGSCPQATGSDMIQALLTAYRPHRNTGRVRRARIDAFSRRVRFFVSITRIARKEITIQTDINGMSPH